MAIINYDALIKRAEKLIKNIEDRSNASSIHICNISENIENLKGLIVILHPDCKPD